MKKKSRKKNTDSCSRRVEVTSNQIEKCGSCLLCTPFGSICELYGVHAIGHRNDRLIANKSLHTLNNDRCELQWSEVIELFSNRFLGTGVLADML